jgi:hypothetical protein
MSDNYMGHGDIKLSPDKLKEIEDRLDSSPEMQRIHAAQAKSKADKAQRDSATAERDSARREVEQEKIKKTACDYFLNFYPMLTKEDFDNNWESNKLAMIQEYQQFLKTAPQLF